MKKSLFFIVAIFVAIMVTTACSAADVAEGTIDVTDTNYVCEYTDGMTAEGVVVPTTTKIIGPAVVKPDRNRSFGIGIPVGETYITKAVDEVAWTLRGDNPCVQAQEKFFSEFKMLDEATTAAIPAETEDKVCKYRDGVTADGVWKKGGTVITAPALIREGTNLILLNSGNYTLKSACYVWEFLPNITPTCLQEQVEYFKGFTPIEVSN